jgi:hypothetical protein
MRIPQLLSASILLALLAACGDSTPPVVLVHATDPHLLDKNAAEQKENQKAFSAMMDAVREGRAGSPRPRVLVITGDFGLELTDPRYTTRPRTRPVSRADTVRAKDALEEVVNITAAEINGSPFKHIYYVPGNNDVLMEDARVQAWGEIDTFVAAVQARLHGKEIRDLTRCYRTARLNPADCTARIDSPYVLVGFPSLSFKNTAVHPEDYAEFVAGTPAVPYDTGTARRIHRQDTLHLALMGRFRQVLSHATAGGWQAVVLTHIPDLDDPHAVAKRRAGDPLAYTGGRFRAALRDNAWNADSSVFKEWKALVEWERVATVLAGHFHASTRETYSRPYSWSDSMAGGVRADRRKILVAPPLAKKFQSSPGARGFTVVSLRRDTTERTFHWLEGSRFRVEAEGDTAAASVAQTRPPPEDDGPLSALGDLDPWKDEEHTDSFWAALVSAVLALLLGPKWRRAPAAAESASAENRAPWADLPHGPGDWLGRGLTSPVARRVRQRLFARFGLAGAASTALGGIIVDKVVGWLLGFLWYVALLAVLLALAYGLDVLMRPASKPAVN